VAKARFALASQNQTDADSLAAAALVKISATSADIAAISPASSTADARAL
jgi:hypothetical protein